MQKGQRLINIELLRIVLMLMIITHHVIIGLGLGQLSSNTIEIDRYTYPELLINSIVAIGVNVFIFISGFFSIQFKTKAVISFIIQALFYSICIYLISLFSDNIQLSLKGMFSAFLPISQNVWWFLSVYIALYFLSPLINNGITQISSKQLLLVIIGLSFLDFFSGFLFGTINTNAGYSIFHFITLYIIGRYLSIIKFQYRHPIIGFLVSTTVMFFCVIFLFNIHLYDKVWKLYSYNNPVIVISSVSFFYIFLNLKFIKYSKAINMISGSVFGIYLIHNHGFIASHIAALVLRLEDKYLDNSFLFWMNIGAIILLVFVVCSIIELSRKQLFRNVENKLSEFINMGYTKLPNKIINRI